MYIGPSSGVQVTGLFYRPGAGLVRIRLRLNYPSIILNGSQFQEGILGLRFVENKTVARIKMGIDFKKEFLKRNFGGPPEGQGVFVTALRGVGLRYISFPAFLPAGLINLL